MNANDIRLIVPSHPSVDAEIKELRLLQMTVGSKRMFSLFIYHCSIQCIKIAKKRYFTFGVQAMSSPNKMVKSLRFVKTALQD